MNEPVRPHQPPKTAVATERPQACPVCDGALVPLRGMARCVRCRYQFCVGCDLGPDVGPAPE
jgi:hypothetical protein